MQIVRLLIGLAFGGLVSCTHLVALRDQFAISDYKLSFEERLHVEENAPIIVLGQVQTVVEIGGPTKSPGDPRIQTQLTKIRIDVKEVIKGDIRVNPMEFYFFTYSSRNKVDLVVPRYMPEAGQRRIYFLKPWQGAYRSLGDVTNYNLPVRTGTHARGFCKGKAPGCCIAELLLVPADDIEGDWFVHDLGLYGAYAAGVLCSPRRAQELLVHLVQHPDARIKDSARDILTMLDQWWPQLKSEGH